MPIIRAILFDLDNTLYDRDLAFEMWARDFVDAYFADYEHARRAEILAQLLVLDASGHRTRAALFADVKALYPALPYEADALCALFYSQWTAHMALDAETLRLLDALDERVGVV